MRQVEGSDPLADYDFDLPEDAIALRPARPRDAARLLVAHADGSLADRRVRDLPDELRPGDLLVVNDSRVIPARLTGVRHRGAAISAVELTLLVEETARTWQAFARPAKRLAPGDTLSFGADGTAEGTVLSREGPTVRVRFEGDPLAVGAMPLPPYIAAHREPDDADGSDYQTVFARPPGSVAAPTAGLHFTPSLIERLEARGVGISYVTLHVGAGTFLPVKAARLDEHMMHAEYGIVGGETVVAAEATRAAGGRVVAVGTTALRLLETAAADGRLKPFRGETRLFIRPGHVFRAADALMTNFHLPRSTLLVLVAAFVGLPRTKAIYAHALVNRYRFYSYGDASLVFPGAA